MGQAFSSVYCDLRFNGSASDHLHGLKLLVWEANVHHVYAPYTLARASIEASSTAVWLLSTKTRGERVLRALRWYAQDCHDSCRFMDDEQYRDHLLRRIEGTVAAGNLDSRAARKRYRATDVVDEADQLVPGTLRAWRAFSGMAHSRMWASRGLLDMEVLSSGQGMVTAKVTSGSAQILWAVVAALNVALSAARLWRDSMCSPFAVAQSVDAMPEAFRRPV